MLISHWAGTKVRVYKGDGIKESFLGVGLMCSQLEFVASQLGQGTGG